MGLLSKLPLNFGLMKEPVNWVIVFLMVAIAGLAIGILFPQPATAET